MTENAIAERQGDAFDLSAMTVVVTASEEVPESTRANTSCAVGFRANPESASNIARIALSRTPRGAMVPGHAQSSSRRAAILGGGLLCAMVLPVSEARTQSSTAQTPGTQVPSAAAVRVPVDLSGRHSVPVHRPGTAGVAPFKCGRHRHAVPVRLCTRAPHQSQPFANGLLIVAIGLAFGDRDPVGRVRKGYPVARSADGRPAARLQPRPRRLLTPENSILMLDTS